MSYPSNITISVPDFCDEYRALLRVEADIAGQKRELEMRAKAGGHNVPALKKWLKAEVQDENVDEPKKVAKLIEATVDQVVYGESLGHDIGTFQNKATRSHVVVENNSNPAVRVSHSDAVLSPMESEAPKTRPAGGKATASPIMERPATAKGFAEESLSSDSGEVHGRSEPTSPPVSLTSLADEYFIAQTNASKSQGGATSRRDTSSAGTEGDADRHFISTKDFAVYKALSALEAGIHIAGPIVDELKERRLLHPKWEIVHHKLTPKGLSTLGQLESLVNEANDAEDIDAGSASRLHVSTTVEPGTHSDPEPSNASAAVGDARPTRKDLSVGDDKGLAGIVARNSETAQPTGIFVGAHCAEGDADRQSLPARSASPDILADPDLPAFLDRRHG